MSKSLSIRDALIAVACLIAGVALAAITSTATKTDGTVASSHKNSTKKATGRIPSGATQNSQEDKTASQSRAAASLDVFAENFVNLEGTQPRIEAMLKWLNGFTPKDYASFVNLLAAYDESEEEASEATIALLEWMFGDNEIIGSLIFERWAAVSPETMADVIQAMEMEMAATVASYSLPFLWRRDPDLAAKIMADLKSADAEKFEDNFDEDIFTQQLYLTSEAAATRWIIENSSEPEDVAWLFELGIRDGKGVMAELLKISDEETRSDSLYEFFEFYALEDAGAAKDLLAEVGAQLDEEAREDLQEELEITWMLEDPAARLDFKKHEDLAFEALEEWTQIDPQAALAWVKGTGKEFISENAFGRLLGRHPASVPFDFLIEHGDLIGGQVPNNWLAALSDSQLDQVIDQIPSEALAELYRRDPDRALALADAQSYASIAGQVGTNPEHREGWFERLPLDQRPAVAAIFFNRWAQDDPAAAFDAASEAGSRSGQQEAVASWLQIEDVEKVYAASIDQLGDSSFALAAMATRWAKRDPQTAGETFLADGRDSAVAPLMRAWVLRDSVGASAFIRENLEPGSTRDAAVAELVGGIGRLDQESAREWAGTIDDQALREQTLSGIGN